MIAIVVFKFNVVQCQPRINREGGATPSTTDARHNHAVDWNKIHVDVQSAPCFVMGKENWCMKFSHFIWKEQNSHVFYLGLKFI